ncbi:protein P21-like [Impatiens glandulifera]|uniref:protein P21-like n=1 Tax=Impatiens glandulifera TaxID=253017 RepID=UPI001FB07D92|nr:protein P21-like [Impatiens glandulifera]
MVSFSFSINSLLLVTSSLLSPSFIDSATFTITNNCSFPVWAAAIPGGGRQLNQSQTWTLNMPLKTTGRIWARTGCEFNESGHGSCQTGDCNGLLECQTYGSPPNTLAEYALNQFNNLDFFDMSLVDGFNLPMQFSPTSNGCTSDIRCTDDIIGQCPNQLQALGGCNNPCTVFKTDQYCCNSSRCEPTSFSRFFKDRCPDAYSYPKDDQTSTFTCPGGTDYKVVFCPGSESIKTRTMCPRNSTISIPPSAKITVVAPAFKSCNKQFYVSLSKQ